LIASLAVGAVSVTLTILVAGTAQAETDVELVSVNTGKCIDAKSEDVPRDAQVQQWECSGKPEQTWNISFAGNDGDGMPLYTISDERTRGCMTVPTTFAVGADVRMRPCSDTASSQRWQMATLPFDTSKHVFRLRVSDFCLDLRGGSGDNGAHIQQYRCNGTEAQQWKIRAQ
jgi:hypothetical protein